MTVSPTLTFGQHAGKTVADLPADYVRWLAHPERATAVKGRGGRPLKPIDPAILEAARVRLAVIEEQRDNEVFAQLCMGGHPTGLAAPTYVIEVEGDCRSRSGKYVLDDLRFGTLGEALARIAEEFPVEEQRDAVGVFARTGPDPEDDLIAVWEVLPTGHRKPVWAFMGWHHSDKQKSWACGQGTLPGDADTLYSLSNRDY